MVVYFPFCTNFALQYFVKEVNLKCSVSITNTAAHPQNTVLYFQFLAVPQCSSRPARRRDGNTTSTYRNAAAVDYDNHVLTEKKTYYVKQLTCPARRHLQDTCLGIRRIIKTRVLNQILKMIFFSKLASSHKACLKRNLLARHHFTGLSLRY